MLAMNMVEASRRLKICEGNLALLREKIAQDPESYEAEFGQQLEHFLQKMRLLQLQPQAILGQMDSLISLTEFIASTAHRFPDKSSQFGQSLLDTLQGSQLTEMDSELRLGLCKACVHLTIGHSLDLFNTVQLMFKLLQIPDKQLRKFILSSLISFIRRCTIGTKRRNKLKRRSNGKQKGGTFGTQASSRLQQFLFSMLQQKACPVSARVAQMALVDAYRKQYWRDAKTANALAEGVFHGVRRIQVSIMRFFLGSSKDEQDGNQEESSDDEERGKQDSKTLKEVVQQFQHAKKTRKRQKQFERAKKTMSREKKSKKEKNARQCNLEAIRSIYDPQKFADRLFGQLDGKKNEKYAIRLLQIALCARVIGVHQLQTLGFYSYMHRYLQPKQKEVTRLLLYAAQACHQFVPPDIVEQLIRVIAQNFVSDRNTPEAITVGLNTIREIYANCPAAATEEMVRDLAEYKRMHNKNVSMAVRSLIVLLRQLRPRLLHRKDRGREQTEKAGIANKAQEFGELKSFDHVPGAEILPESENETEKLAQQMRSSDDEYEDFELESDGESGEEEENTNSEMEIEDENGEDEEEEENDIDIGEEEEDENGNGEMEKKPRNKLNKSVLKSQKKAEALTEQKDAQERAKQISEARILTDADFQLIRIRQLRQQAGLEQRGIKRTKTNDQLRVEEEIREKFARTEGDGLPRLNEIEHFHKKMRRQTKEERLEQIMEGREGRPEYGRPKKRGAHVGRTNRELAKRKNYQMVRHKVRGKNRQRSFRDRQITLRNYLLRQQGKKV